MVNVDQVIEKSAILVTTFNPEISLFSKNLSSYISQIPLVLICDNSNCDKRKNEIRDLISSIGNAMLVDLCGNKGIASAQNKGIELAIQHGVKYILEMDQDSQLPPTYTRQIASSYCELINSGKIVAGIGPLAESASEKFLYHKRKPNIGLISVDKTLSSGFFYSLSTFKVVGPKLEQLFIDYVDWEWCWRASSKGYSTFIDTSLRISHKLGEGHRKILFWRVGMPAPIRHYYQYRNSLYLFHYKHIPLKWKISRILVNLVKFPIYTLLSDRKLLRASYIVSGIADWFLGRLGEYKGKESKA